MKEYDSIQKDSGSMNYSNDDMINCDQSSIKMKKSEVL